ncbi:hypothetical protein GCM10028807_38520 [Spirosoma daeguense]
MLISWNSQGKNPTSYILSSNQDFPKEYTGKPDCICIQEAGDWSPYSKGNPILCNWNPAPSYGYYKELSTVTINNANYIGYVVPWQASIDGNNRCTLVILWRQDLGTYRDFPIKGWHDGHETHRPVFWITTSIGKIGCIHAPSGGGASTFLYIVNAITQISGAGIGGNWLIAGDFNYVAVDMKANLPKGVSIIDSREATQKSGGNIDYLLCNDQNNTYRKAKAAENYVQSDHLQIRFIPNPIIRTL